MERDYRPQPLEAPSDSQGGNTSGGEMNSLPALQEQEQANPDIAELLRFLYDTYALRNSLQSAADEQQSQQNIEDLSAKATEHHDNTLNFPSLAERYRRGILFIDAAMHITRGSFAAYPEDPEYLRNVLDAAFLPYGFKIALGSAAEVEKQAPYGFHHGLDHQSKRYEDSRRVKKLPSEMLQFYNGEDQYGADQWGAIGQWQEEPEAIRFAQELKKIDAVRSHRPVSRRTENVLELHPTYLEHCYLAGIILGEVREIMTEGINPYGGPFRPLISLVNHFNDALHDLDMHIDVNPDWQPEQAPYPSMEKTAIAEELSIALTPNYSINVTEIPQTENSEASQEDTTPLPWQQKIDALLQQKEDTESIKAFPAEPLKLLENLHREAQWQKDTNTAYILEGLLDGYVASAFPFLPPLIQEKYTEQYYDRGYLAPTEEEEGLCFTDEEYGYLNKLLESANIAELYKQKGEGEIPHFNKGENEQYIRLNPVLTEMRKIATERGLDWE